MKINALVVDDSKEFISSVVKYFQNNSIVNIKKTLTNENEVVPYLEENKDFIDLIIINLEMNNQDNIWLLNELDKRNIKKHLIALSNYKKDCAFNLANLRNVDYYMFKPINLDYLNSRIRELFDSACETEDANQLERQVSSLLHYLAIPTQVKGYLYLREGIVMLYNSSNYIGITKELYPYIASKHNTTPSRVERAIRHAIEIAWNRADYELMNKIFGHSIDFNYDKPSNREFMTTLSDAIHLNKIEFQELASKVYV